MRSARRAEPTSANRSTDNRSLLRPTPRTRAEGGRSRESRTAEEARRSSSRSRRAGGGSAQARCSRRDRRSSAIHGRGSSSAGAGAVIRAGPSGPATGRAPLRLPLRPRERGARPRAAGARCRPERVVRGGVGPLDRPLRAARPRRRPKPALPLAVALGDAARQGRLGLRAPGVRGSRLCRGGGAARRGGSEDRAAFSRGGGRPFARVATVTTPWRALKAAWRPG